MTSIRNNNQAQYGNALATSIIGGALWGTGEYIFNKKPYLDSNGFVNDTFVKTLKEGLEAVQDSETLTILKNQVEFDKKIDALEDIGKLKKFLTENKEQFNNYAEKEMKYIDDVLISESGDLKKCKEFVKKIFKMDGDYKKFFQDTYEKCLNDGKFVFDKEKISQESFDIIKRSAKNYRMNTALKSAGVFTGICAVLSCMIEFWASKKARKQ